MADGVQNNAVKDDKTGRTAGEQDSLTGESDAERKDKTVESLWSAPIMSFARKASESISSGGLRRSLSGCEAPNPDTSDSSKQ
ncbi:RUN and FYVE domain-containing protein 1-like isoform X1, partial [Tachysurus ichikawai]